MNWNMKITKTLMAVGIAFATPAHAFYTECTVQADTQPVNRPGGNTEPRWSPLEKGDKVAIRDTYQDWVFVYRYQDESAHYYWVRRNVLRNCREQEGTP
jgi:hypothetical protein